MRIKRTGKNFTVRQKADRKIHYAGQGKKYTENTANFSPKEKQDVLRQKNILGSGEGIQAQSSIGGNIGNSGADNIAKSYQQEHGNVSGNKVRDYSVPGNLHVKRPLQEYQKESISHGEKPAGNKQAEQQQQQQIQRPSAYHENNIKTKETVLHRKSDIPFRIKRADDFSLKERKNKKEKAQKPKQAVISRAHRDNRTGESRQEKASGNISTDNKAGNPSSLGYAQSFSDRRDEQIFRYKKRKFFKAGKPKYSNRKTGLENAVGMADTGKTAEPSKIPEAYRLETQPPQMQGIGQSALSQTQNNLSAGNDNTSHIKKRNAGDSIRKRDGDISGRKDKAGRSNKKNKKDKGKNKDTKKDNSRRNSKNRKDRAAAFRLLSYVSDKLSMEEQKDSLLKVAKDLLIGKAKAAVAGKLLSIGAALVPALIPVFILTVIITLLFNSPFSILLPKLSEEPGAVEVLIEYTEDFREIVQEELADPGSGDETELIYEDYEGDGEPDNMADILMVYMHFHGLAGRRW